MVLEIVPVNMFVTVLFPRTFTSTLLELETHSVTVGGEVMSVTVDGQLLSAKDVYS